MYLPTTNALLPTLLLLLNPVTSRPAPSPSPQNVGIPTSLQCQNGPTCPSGMIMACSNGYLYCYAGIISVDIGKCSDCVGSMCAKSADDYPGDSTPKPATPTKPRAELAAEKRNPDPEVEPRQTFGGWCQAGWSCACVAFDGKGYHTRGKGSMCPVDQGAIESCTEENGFACDFACRSPLLNGFTNAKCHALFPGTRAVCRSY